MEIASENTPPAPVVFVSYSWASEEHKAWVLNLASRLRTNGVDVYLDRWDVRLGSDLYAFMEQFADQTARVLVVLSDDYGPKADSRVERASGVGTETTIISPTVYQSLGGNRVVPIVPDSGTVADQPVLPIYLETKKWLDFRQDHEHAYEALLRELHKTHSEVAPALGKNPFEGVTDSQARSAIRNDPGRWKNLSHSGSVEVNINQNSGRFTIGSGDASFSLSMEYPFSPITPEGSKQVRHYSDYGHSIGLVVTPCDRPEVLDDLATLDMSNRVVTTNVGDLVVMLNHRGYWALMIVDEIYFHPGFNGYDPIIVLRYVIATDRSPHLDMSDLPTEQHYEC